MDSQQKDVAITFYNVAEMAAEAKRLTQAKQENFSFNKKAHTEDELAAALGLIMMRYQPKLSIYPSVIAELGTRHKTATATIHDKSDFENDDAKQRNQEIKFRTATNKVTKRSTLSSKSSLLSSCRHILKEFLSQQKQL